MKILVCIISAFLVLGCGIDTRTCDVADVTKGETIVLNKKAGQGSIVSVVITGGGKLEGKAVISLILNGQPYKTKTLSGPVDFRWDGDWYSDRAEIRYIPISVTDGKITLQYHFYE